MSAFVLKGDLCYSTDPRTLRTLPNGYLVCENGVSAGVWKELPEKYQGLPLIDHSGKLILPGLVDLHKHAPQYSFRALGMDLELMDWLNTHTFPEEARYKDVAYAKKAYDLVVEDLLHGPNTRTVLFATAHTQATLLLMDIMERSGLVSYVGRVNMDRSAPDTLQEPSAKASLSATREWLEAAKIYENTQPILTPRFIPSCSDALMRGLAQLQQELQLPLQSHLCENLGEIAFVKELCPASTSYTAAYYDAGMLRGLPTIMAHCVWNQEDEIQLLKQSGTYVAHCPQSNTNLSSGIAPIRRYLREGLKVGLGSDVAGGCHTSIFRAMTDAIQVSKLRWRLVDAEDAPLTFPEAFYLATLGGGSFFGKVGSFEEGYELDAIVVNDESLASPRPLSVEERLARVAYLSDDRHIVGKYVRGKKLF